MPSLKHAALLCAVLGMAAGCAGGKSTASVKPTPASVTEGGSAAGAAGSAGNGAPADSPAFTCIGAATGGSPSLRGQLTDLRVAAHPGFDRITFQFAGQGVPAYKLMPQPSPAFVKDPSGLPLDLSGSQGLRVSFPSSSGLDMTVNPVRRTYTGSQDLKPGLPTVRQLAELGDFENVMSWGAGLSGPACLRISELAKPSRLVIDLRPGPEAASAAQLAAVGDRIYHPIPGGYSAGCEQGTWEDQALCPITDRFVTRLHQETSGPGVNLFCRCQNGDPAIHAMTVEPTAGGGVAHVTTGFSHVDLIIKDVSGKLLADDVQCPGNRPQTSIYITPLTGC